MKSSNPTICALLIIVLFISGCDQSEVFPDLRGPYLGQKPPGMTAEIFAPGILSHGFHEHKITLSPDGSEMFYVMSDSRAQQYYIIRVHMMENNQWNEPEVAFFSGKNSDISPAFSPDGTYLLFSSYRPIPGLNNMDPVQELWISRKQNGAWSDPEHIPLVHDKNKREINPSVSANGNLYFQANYDIGWNIYYCSYKDGKYSEPVRMEAPINSDSNDGGPFIAPDESYLLFHSNRPGGFGRSDLYVSFKRTDGSWTEPKNLGDSINSEDSDTGPFLSFDEKYLFFSSFRTYHADDLKGKIYQELLMLYKKPLNGSSSLYWAEAGIIDKLKPDK